MIELIRDSKGELLRAETFSATRIHTPNPDEPSKTLCGMYIFIRSEFMCDPCHMHSCPTLHVVKLGGLGAEGLCARCEKSVAKRLSIS